MLKYALILMLFTGSAFASAPQVGCNNAITTIEIGACKQQDLKVAEKTLAKYLQQGAIRYQDDAAVIEQLEAAQQHWLAYRKTSCDAQYQIWRDGTIRSLIALSCQIEMTEQRTLHVWQNYLTFMDNSTPILPDPRH